MVEPWLWRSGPHTLDKLDSGVDQEVASPAGQSWRPLVVQGFLPCSCILRRPQHSRAKDLPSEPKFRELPRRR